MIFIKLLLIFHVIGDFYSQTRWMNEHKKSSFWCLLLHVAIYLTPFISIIWLSNNLSLTLLMLAIIFVTHIGIDFLKVKFDNKSTKKSTIFLIDQAMHVIVVIIVSLIMKATIVDFSNANVFLRSIEIQVDFNKIIGAVLIFLLIIKPTSIFIEMMLPINSTSKNHENSKTSDKSDEEKDDTSTETINDGVNYGAFIGILERIVIVLLAILNLWPSIALVITAKSIARFKQLENKGFAQKYLIGTLLSLSATLVFLILFL